MTISLKKIMVPGLVMVTLLSIFQVLWLVQPAHAYSVTNVGRWKLDENPVVANGTVADSVGINNGVTPSNWSGFRVSPIAPSGNGAFYFPGWNDIINTNQVDATASSFTIPNSDLYNPNTSDFQVSAWVKTDDPAPALTAGHMVNSDSLNIIQKGLAGTNSQQWKMSVTAAGKFICTFRGPDANGIITNFKATSSVYPWGVTRQITCSWDATTKIITTKVTTAGITNTFPAAVPGPVSVTNTDNVTVGKKPGSTYPGDTFAGTLDVLIISKGL